MDNNRIIALDHAVKLCIHFNPEPDDDPIPLTMITEMADKMFDWLNRDDEDKYIKRRVAAFLSKPGRSVSCVSETEWEASQSYPAWESPLTVKGETISQAIDGLLAKLMSND